MWRANPASPESLRVGRVPVKHHEGPIVLPRAIRLEITDDPCDPCVGLPVPSPCLVGFRHPGASRLSPEERIARFPVLRSLPWSIRWNMN